MVGSPIKAAVFAHFPLSIVTDGDADKLEAKLLEKGVHYDKHHDMLDKVGSFVSSLS